MCNKLLLSNKIKCNEHKGRKVQNNLTFANISDTHTRNCVEKLTQLYILL